MLTAIPVVEVTSLNVKSVAPLLVIDTAPPVVDETLLNVTVDGDESAFQFSAAPPVVLTLFVPLTFTVPPPVAVKPAPEAPVIPTLLRLKMPPLLLVRLTPLAAPVAPIVMSRTVVVPVVIAFPSTPEPADGLIVRSSTRVLVLSVTMVAALLSTGVVLAGKVSVWLFGFKVMPASVK